MDTTEWVREHSWVLAPGFIFTLAIILWIKRKLANTIDIKPVDVGVALIPFLLWMATAGILKKVEVPGILSFETADAIVSAAAAPIKSQVSTLPVTALKADAKQGVRDIPRLIQSGTQVLSFRLGYGAYYGPAVWMYLNQLVNVPAFKYVVITDEDDSLFGLFEARQLTTVLNPQNNDELIKDFPLHPYTGLPPKPKIKNWVNFSDSIRSSDKEKIAKIRGFVSLSMSVKSGEDKKRVLEQMEDLGLDWLPVVQNEQGIHRFQGIVERSRLTASLILDVTNQLESKKIERKTN